MSPLTAAVPGPREAAVALVALGPERAATILRGLGPEQARVLAAEVAALGPVQPSEVREILGELVRGLSSPLVLPAPGKAMAKDLLVRALGPEIGRELGDELDVPVPFAWLEQADPEAAGNALAKEAPGAVALALAHVHPRTAAALLLHLPESDRTGVATRIAALGAVHPDTVRQVEAALFSRVSDLLTTSSRRLDGPEVLAGLLSNTARETSRDLLTALAETHPDLAEATRDRLFTFDDFCALPARTLQVVLRSIDSKQLALALRNLPESTVATVLANLSERAREGLTEEMELVGNAKQSDVEQARRAVVTTARGLEESGDVELTGGAE